MTEEQPVQVFSIEELLSDKVNAVRYNTVPAYGGHVRIGSLSAADMLAWVEENQANGKTAGLRLLARSIVNDGNQRVPPDQLDRAAEAFGNKDNVDNASVIAACLRLNGLDRAAQIAEAIKNA